MHTAPPTASEQERLLALESFGVLDTDADPFFDHITAIAAEICETPMALVSFVDEGRQWFKSRVGVPVAFTPRDQAFCAHAILEPEQFLVVPDALADPRFADNPLVLGDPNIRFYAGAPLVDPEGHALGTLCVLDRVPRELTAGQIRALGALREALMAHLAAQRAAKSLAESVRARTDAERVLAAQQAVLGVLVETASVSDVGDRLVRAFGDALGLDASALWLLDTGGDRMVCGGAWGSTNQAEPFTAASRGRVFETGVGLPGRVLSSGSLAVIEDVTVDANFPRAEAARASGLRGGFGIPLRGADGVIGVLEVFSRSSALPDPQLLGTLESLGRQIGIALERERAGSRALSGATLLRAIIDSALDCIVTIDHSGAITDFNPAAQRTFGWSAAEALGRDLGKLLVPERMQKAHADGMTRHMLTGVSRILGRRLEVPAVRADGTEFPIELTVLRLPGDGPPRFTAFLRDITERQEAQAAMTAARTAAEEANRAKSEFLAVMSHEIRTPMHAIIGMTDLALDGATSSEQRDILLTVQSNAEHLLGIVSEILDHSKLEAGQMEIALEAADCASVADGVVESLDNRAAERGVDLTSDVAPGFPDSLLIDRFRLRQVLMNLVGNALKFTRTGEVKVSLGTAHEQEDTVWVHCVVEDTGVGIPQDALSRIFEQFFQVDSSTTRNYGGTGLGLSITHALVTLMGGRIWAESEPGKGSVFHVLFPAKRGVEAMPRRRASDVFFKPAHVLVIQPASSSRTALVHALEHRGLQPIVSTDVAECCARIGAEQALPALIFVDETIPLAEVEAGCRQHAAPGVVPPPMIVLSRRRHGRTDPPAGVGLVLSRPLTGRRVGTAAARALGLAPADGSAADRTVESTPLRILLVEDHADSRRYAERMLQRAGHRVDTAINGAEALERAHDARYNLIFTDVEMPVMDGISFARELRAAEAATGDAPTPIVALSGHALLGFREQCLEAGMNDHLAKPATPEALLTAVRKHADSRPAVLVADDDADGRHLVERYLEGAEYRLVFAETGERALAQFRRGQVALLLLDMEMPGMSGYRVAEAIRAEPGGESVAICAITGHTGPVEEARCRAAGCSTFLSKPVRRDVLQQLVAAEIERPMSLPAPDEAVRGQTESDQASGATAASATPVVTAATSGRHVVHVDPDIADLVPGFLAGRRRDVEELHSWLAAGRFADIRRLGHNLKGSGRAYGFVRITELGVALESAGVHEDPAPVPDLIAELDHYLQSVDWTSDPPASATIPLATPVPSSAPSSRDLS